MLPRCSAVGKGPSVDPLPDTSSLMGTHLAGSKCAGFRFLPCDSFVAAFLQALWSHPRLHSAACLVALYSKLCLPSGASSII